jgi:glucose/arabinose dehydrogenase
MGTKTTLRQAAIFVAAMGCAACGRSAQLPVAQGMGPTPTLPKPSTSLFPTIRVATAVGWADSAKPVAAPGLEVSAFARGLDHPRWLYVLPNGDVLVAETNAPPRPLDNRGLRGMIFKRYQKRAGGAAPTANRITLLRDADGDGVAELKTPFIEKLNSPFGMALVGNTFYVANTDAVVSFPYNGGETRITAAPVKVADLPGGLLNHHWTKSLIANPEGTRLYVGVGSNSNVAENGMEAEDERAAILEIDPATGMHRIYASGLRNPVGMAWEPVTGMLWTAVNERDELGSDLVPDYMTSVKDGGFYGWPYSYFGQHVDTRIERQRPDLVAKAIVPDYALGPHTASLGLAWAQGTALPARYDGGMFVGQHGSWNRKPPSGYRVIFVPFANGKPSGEAVDVLTGFLDGDRSRGRPVGVAIDQRGSLLVADDVGNVIWRVGPSSVTATRPPR